MESYRKKRKRPAVYLAVCLAVLLGVLLPARSSAQSSGVQMQITAGPNGSISVRKNKETVLEVRDERLQIELQKGSKIELQIQAAAGYVIEQCRIDGHTRKPALNESKWSEELAVDADISVEVRFASTAAAQSKTSLQQSSTDKDSTQSRASFQESLSQAGSDQPSNASSQSRQVSSLEASSLQTDSKSKTDASKSENKDDSFLPDSLTRQENSSEESKADSSLIQGMDPALIEKGMPGGWYFENPDDLPESGIRIERADTAEDDESQSGQVRIRSTGLSVTETRILSGIHIGQGAVQTNGVWRLSNGRMAFCGNYRSSTPRPGDQTSAPRELDSPAMRKVLYYGYEGPENMLGSFGFSNEAQMIVMCDLVSQANVGGCISHNVCPEPNWNRIVKPVWDAIQAKPDPAGFKALIVDVYGTGTNIFNEQAPKQPLVYGELKAPGELFVMKRSTSEEIFSLFPSTIYSLEGAQFYVSRKQPDSTWRYITTISTDNSGRTETLSLMPGTYKVEESSPPSGYWINHETWIVDVKEGQRVGNPNAVIEVREEPDGFCQSVILRKYNTRERYGTKPSLAGAEFELCYYAQEPGTPQSELKKPKKTWVYKTDTQGVLSMTDASYVRGDQPYKDSKGRHLLPFGMLTVSEVKAPAGYEKSDETLVFSLGKPGVHNVSSYPFTNETEFAQVPLGLTLRKRSADGDKVLAGAEFTLKAPDGSSTKVVTDSKGEAALHFSQKGTYRLQETKAPKGYSLLGDEIVLNVSADSITLRDSLQMVQLQSIERVLNVLDAPLAFDLEISKTDETGKSLAQAGFALYTDQAKTNQVASGRSDADGRFVLRSLPFGKYYLCEYEAPDGFFGDMDEKGKTRLHKIEVKWEESRQEAIVKVDDQECKTDGAFHISTTNSLSKPMLTLCWSCVNEKVRVLPETGSAQMSALEILGAALTLAALSKNPKKRQTRNAHRKRANRKGKDTRP